MKYVNKRQPTQQEIYRIYEVMFYLSTNLMEETSTKPINQILYALSIIADVPSSLITLAYGNLQHTPPSKQEIAIALAYLDVPIRLIKKRFIHSKTYYKYVYDYFNGELQIDLIPILPEELLYQVIKFTTNIKEFTDIFLLTNRRITYDE